MIVLASTSPRRIQLLESLGVEFTIKAPTSIEAYQDHLSPSMQVQQLAFNKALSVFSDDEIVIGGDTVVVFDHKLLGKPKDKEDAFNMLNALNGKTHQVITSLCVMSKEKTITQAYISHVTLKKVNESQLKEYIQLHQPFDKAGSYGIQDEYFKKNILDNHDGYLNTIIGFPVEELKKILESEFSYDSSI